MCQQLGGLFPGKKGGYPGPWPMAALCEQQGAVCTSTALFFSVCALPRAKDLWEFREGTGWISRLCHCPRATPGHCQSGEGHKHQRLLSLCLSYLVPHPACPTTSQVPLQEENKCAGCSAPQWLEDTREAGCEQRTA